MDIRKTDSKGRIAVGNKGTNYITTLNEDGSITLTPVLEAEAKPYVGMRIFNRPLGTGKTTELVKIMLEPGNGDVYYVAPTRAQAENAANIAKELILKAAKSNPEVKITHSNLGYRFLSVADLTKADPGTRYGSRYVIDEISGVIGALISGEVLAIAGTDGKMKADQINALGSVTVFSPLAADQIAENLRKIMKNDHRGGTW